MAHYKGAASEAGRAMQLIKKRELAQMEIEFRKKKIEEDLKLSNIENKFAAHYDAVEQQLKTSTIGLVTLDEMKAKQENIVKERERKLAQKQAEKEREQQRQLEAKQAEKNRQKKQIQALSFAFEEDSEEQQEEDEEEEEVVPVKKIRKNPEVDTSFLPDREREEQETRLREELRQEWAAKQSSLKEEDIDITFSYWDGSGHRRTVRMKKGNSIYQFLQRCLETLRKEFSELKTVTADQLMYVKEDLILPQHYTFYDFIVTKSQILAWDCNLSSNIYRFINHSKFDSNNDFRACFLSQVSHKNPQLFKNTISALSINSTTDETASVSMARGKSGPLFMFDAHDDIRMISDASVEKEDSHAGKVLLRSWYERNKHIFPASRWEPFDPTKSYDKYTVKDKKK